MSPDQGGDGASGRDAVRFLQERIQLLSETLRAFAEASSDTDGLLQTIVRRTSVALGGFCSIALVSDDGARLEPGAMFDPDPEVVRTIERLGAVSPFRLDGPHPLVRCLDASAPTLLDDFGPDTVRARVRDPDDQRAALALGVRAMLVASLRAHGKRIGLLMLIRHGSDAQPFAAVDQQLTQSLADHAALAISNARLFEHAERQLAERKRVEERLRQLTDLSREFAAATHDFQGLLDLLARRLGELIGEGCLVRLLGNDGPQLEATGSVYHPDPSVAAQMLGVMRAFPQRLGSGVAGKVVATACSVVVPEDSPEQITPMIDVRMQPLVSAIGLRGFVTVPLRSGDTVIGVVSPFRCHAGKPYTDDEVRLVEDIASHAALALINARLFFESRRELAEREKAQRALKHAEEQLRQSQKMEAVGRLAGGVAHDFNNLLSVVLSYSKLLIGGLSVEDPMRADLEEIDKAGERAADLTRQLLAFSRQQVLETRVIDMNATIANMDKLLHRLTGENVKLCAALPPDVGRVKGDTGSLEQVVMNLVVNARDAMPQGGTLQIETCNVEVDDSTLHDHAGAKRGSYVLLSVRDTGTGMDDVTRQRIFEPFFTTKEKGKGTGLGLSTVFGIVKQMGGSIRVTSELGHGSCFEVLLPRTHEVAPAPRPPSAVPQAGASETVLLVEDEAPVRAVIKGVLERSGYHVIAAHDGPEAIRLCKVSPRPIDLLLTDMMMPKMNGRELAERLQPSRPAMKVLYMSGYTDDTIVHDGVLASTLAFIPKPLTPDTLLRKVRQVLDHAPPVPGPAAGVAGSNKARTPA